MVVHTDPAGHHRIARKIQHARASRRRRRRTRTDRSDDSALDDDVLIHRGWCAGSIDHADVLQDHYRCIDRDELLRHLRQCAALGRRLTRNVLRLCGERNERDDKRGYECRQSCHESSVEHYSAPRTVPDWHRWRDQMVDDTASHS
jgi:hypothetical protein